jgi:hypothetical protein
VRQLDIECRLDLEMMRNWRYLEAENVYLVCRSYESGTNPRPMRGHRD